jgi:hypothetical protein
LQGDNAKAPYQNFLTLWKNADPDLSTLKEDKAEYAEFQQSLVKNLALESPRAYHRFQYVEEFPSEYQRNFTCNSSPVNWLKRLSRAPRGRSRRDQP